jgi:hypothetical protein
VIEEQVHEFGAPWIGVVEPPADVAAFFSDGEVEETGVDVDSCGDRML